MKIGNRLKELRIQKGLTQEELAGRSELSKGFISQLERDLTSPSIATLVDILQCLGTDLQEFFSETMEEEQIVFHDADYFIQPIFNCCLIDIKDMLDNGTSINGKMIEASKQKEAQNEGR